MTEIIGSAELGDINIHLTTLKHFLTGESPSLAFITVMSFIVRGLFSNLQITDDLLYDPFREAVFCLERFGFKVLLIQSLILR